MHLGELFNRSVQMYPEQVALLRGHGNATSFQALDPQVASLAYWLKHDLGLERGDRVVLAMKNCGQYIQSMLAAWRAGLCVVPVNSKLHAHEIITTAQDCAAKVCLSQGAMTAPLQNAAAAAPHPALRVIDVDSSEFSEAFSRPALPLQSKDEQDLAWLFYTSGTTGRPKGVMLTHANLVAMAMAFCHDLQDVAPGDALIHVAPLSHGSGLYSIPYWIKGATQIIPESGGFDEEELFSFLDAPGRISLFAAPTIVRRMARHAEKTGSTSPGLRCILVGGAPFYVEDIKEAVRCFGPRVGQLYGQGETPMTISCMPASLLAAAVTANDEAVLSSVGYAMTPMQVEIRDERGEVLPPGELGEVTVAGPTVMQGYWNNPAATAATIRGGALYTGDVGLKDDRGLLYLRDRSKDVIISGGANIYPREVEEVLLRHPQVREASVVGLPDPEWGETVVACLVTPDGAPIDEAELDALCLQSIARFKRPKRYVFVATLPKNATGKVLKRELREQMLARTVSE